MEGPKTDSNSFSQIKEDLIKSANEKKKTNPLKLPEIFNFFDTESHERKWANNYADITDYFNYGFNEQTFKIYSKKVKNLYAKLQNTGGVNLKSIGESDKFFEDKVPITHGGLEVMSDDNLKQSVSGFVGSGG